MNLTQHLLTSICLSMSQACIANTTLNQNWEDFQKSPIQTSQGFPYQHCFKQAAKEQKLSESLLLAVAKGESNFNPKAVSKANAHGLMQIQWPGTAKDLGFTRKSQLYQPCKNVKAGAKYLKQMSKRYGGNMHLALAAYNYGPGRIAVDAKPENLPKGATWYSAYVYDHLQSVIGHHENAYQPQNQVTLLHFEAPFRARAFVKYIKRKATTVNISWVKQSNQKFAVVMQYDNQKMYRRSKNALKKLGFKINAS
jgi:membrane-bound lytic murein transglycosylase MltF